LKTHYLLCPTSYWCHPARINTLALFLYVSLLFFIPLSVLHAAQCTGTTHGAPFRGKEITTFIPEEDIFYALSCGNMQKAEYGLVIDWIDPTGAIRGQTTDQIIVSDNTMQIDKIYAVKLPKKGHVSRMLTGSRYGDELYGTWTYRVHLNGTLLNKGHFSIH
jgi:hypothetical protein